jgi:hypothetical protein
MSTMTTRKWNAQRQQAYEGETSAAEYAILPTKERIAISVDRCMDRFPQIVRPENYATKESAVRVTKAWWLSECRAVVARRAAEQEEEDNDTEEGYESPYMGGQARRPTAESLAQEKDFFIEALPACDALTAGFGMDTAKNNWCHCPMSRGMKYWRNIFGYHLRECTASKPFTPDGLRGHLSSKGCDWHRITEQYIKSLYPRPVPDRKRKHDASKGSRQGRPRSQTGITQSHNR